MDPGKPLSGGRQTRGVVQIGDTVRRPRSERSDFVARLLRHLEARNFSGVPSYLGSDTENRDVFSFLPGDVDRTSESDWVNSLPTMAQGAK